MPELHPLEKLLEVKALLSPGQWSALYQQTPIAEGGNIFQEDWIRRWDASTYPPYFEEVIASWDMTFKDTDGLRLCRRAGMGAVRPQSLPARSDPQTHGLYGFESGRAGHARPLAAGDGGAHRRQGERPGGARRPARGGAGLIPVLPDGSKVARAYAVTPLWAGGNVWIPEDDAVWTRDFVEELVAFPAGAHDDQVDAMTQALRYLRSHGLAVWEALADD